MESERRALDSFREAAKGVFAAMVEELEEESLYESDPFVYYGIRLRLSLIKKRKDFNKRVADGQFAIMEMLNGGRGSCG